MGVVLLVVDNLSVQRGGEPLFNGVSFVLNAGDVVHLQGCNGAGKTTLLRTVAGLLDGCCGHIAWRGQPLQQARLDFCAQSLFFTHHTGLKPELTPLENLRWKLAFTQSAWSMPQALNALARVGLAGYEELPCSMLSAGQQRRVLFAQLIVQQASLWILDEPFTAIDVSGVALLEQLIDEHVAQGGMVLLTSHQSVSLQAAVSVVDLADFPPVLEALL